jgi:hypothetical protein
MSDRTVILHLGDDAFWIGAKRGKTLFHFANHRARAASTQRETSE